MENLEIKTKKAKKINYTETDVAELLRLYEIHGTEQLNEIAETMDRPIRSIRSKLVSLGVYVPAEKKNTRKNEGPLKKELVKELCDLTGCQLKGIDPASKEALSELIDVVKYLRNNNPASSG